MAQHTVNKKKPKTRAVLQPGARDMSAARPPSVFPRRSQRIAFCRINRSARDKRNSIGPLLR
jgi:hypothetical protein